MSDKEKALPTRVGPSSGRANENQMLSGVDVGGFSKSYRVNADGSETMLKTRGGFPQFTTTKPETEFYTDNRLVFQAYPVIGQRDLSLGLSPGWGGFYRPPSDRTQLLSEYGVPEKPHKELWVASGEIDLSKMKEVRTHHRGNLDWFPSSGTDDHENITVTWSTAWCGGRYTPDGEPNNVEPFYGPHYAPNSHNKLADRFPSVYLDGDKVLQLGGMWRYETMVNGVLQLKTVDYTSTEGQWILCAAAVWHTFPGKSPAWRVIALVTNGTQAKLVGQAARGTEGSYCEGWDVLSETANLDKDYFQIAHPPVFNGSATEIAALGKVGATGRMVIRRFAVPGLAMSEDEADAYGYTESPNQIDGSDAIYAAPPGGGPSMMLRDEIPTLTFDTSVYASEKVCVAIDYAGDTLKKFWHFGSSRRTVSDMERIGELALLEFQSFDTSAAHQQNIDTIMAIDWSEKGGGSYTEEEAAAISRATLGGDPDIGIVYSFGTPSQTCLTEDGSLFRWLSLTNPGRKQGLGSAITQSSVTTSESVKGVVLPSGTEIRLHTWKTVTIDGAAWFYPGDTVVNYALGTRSASVIAPIDTIYSSTVTLNCVNVSHTIPLPSPGGEIEDSTTNTEAHAEQRIWTYELRHNAWVTGPRDYARGMTGKSFSVGEPSITPVTSAVSSSEGAPVSTPTELGLIGGEEVHGYFLIAAHQSGQDFVICPADAPWSYADPENMGLFHAKADGTITEIDPGLDTSTSYEYAKRFVAPIFYRKKKRLKTEKI